MPEINEITQIVRLEFEGVQLALKVGGASLKTLQKVAKFLYGLLTMEKTKGKTSLKEMLMRGGDMQVFQFEERDMKKVKKLCKKLGLLYTEVPKTDKEATTRELLFHSESVPRVSLLLDKLDYPKNAVFKSMNNYVNEMDDKTVKVYEDVIEKQEEKQQEKETKQQEKEEKKTDGVSERKEELDQVANRIHQVNQQQNRDVHGIFIPKRMILGEDETQIRIRVPDTPMDEPRFIGIDKKDLIPGEEKKGYLSFLDKSAHYEIFDRQGQRLGTIRGDDLFQKHFSKLGRILSEDRRERKPKSHKKTRQKVR